MSSLIPFHIESDRVVEIDPPAAGNYLQLYEKLVPYDRYELHNLKKKLKEASEKLEDSAMRLSKAEAQWLYERVFDRIREISHTFNEGLHGGEVGYLNKFAQQFGVDVTIVNLGGGSYGWDQNPVRMA